MKIRYLQHKLYKLYCLFLLSLSANASDTLQPFTIKDFFAQILAHHPIAKQAQLLDESALQELRIARSFLDPVIGSSYYEKQFDNKQYYRLWDNYLQIPTWYGIDIQAGFERNIGAYVSNEKYTPLQGLSYLGISVPLGQGMLIDERRSTILQARQLALLAESERIKAINKLLLQAGKEYWDWMYFYHKLNFHRLGFELSSARFKAVKERSAYGDLSAIDTVEALIQVQNYKVLLTQSEVEYQNSRLILSNYLWEKDNVPVEISDKLIPSDEGTEIMSLNSDSLKILIESAKINHPEIVKLNAKTTQMEIERRFAGNKFLPKIKLNYHLLQKGFYLNSESFSNQYASKNYKFGISFSYPLLLRNERGKYKLTGIKLQQLGYDIIQTNREIQNEIYNTANEWTAYENQLIIQESLVKNVEILRNGEQIKFESGESSLFLINSRDNYLINSQVKLIELRSKYAKTKIALGWAAGNMINF